MLAFGRVARSVLDRVYVGCGIVAALFLIAILSLIVVQMLARWTGEVFPGAPDYASYSMAAASFFAFAHALNRGAHCHGAHCRELNSDLKSCLDFGDEAAVPLEQSTLHLRPEAQDASSRPALVPLHAS